jgi:stage V sporulation protein B
MRRADMAEETAAPAGSAETTKKSDDTTRAAGRGGLAIAVAKMSFLVTGFAQQLLLSKLLGDAGYGAVSKVLIAVSILNNVIVATGIQGLSRTVSAAKPGEEDADFRRILTLHTVLAIIISMGFAAATGFIADQIFAQHVVTPIRIVSAVVLLYGVYAPLVGALNGRRAFLAQAGLDIFYGMSRLILLCAGAMIGARVMPGGGVLGAAVGFAASAALILPIALWRAGTGRSGPSSLQLREYLAFLGPLALGQLALNLLLQTDMFLLMKVSGARGTEAGVSVAEKDSLVAVYRGMQLFGFLPYQLLMAVQFVLFPMLAKAQAEGDREAIRRYVRVGVRMALLIVGLVAGPIAALGPHVLRFAFTARIADEGGEALRILAPGMGAFAILSIACAALTSLRRERVSMAIVFFTLVSLATSVWMMLRGVPFGKSMVDRAALGTICAMFACAFVAAVTLWRATGAFVRPLTLVRTALAMGITIFVGRHMPWISKPLVPIQAGMMMVVYVVLLVVSGELGKADLQTVKTVLGRKKAATG